MGLRDARPKIKELKTALLKRFPAVELHEGWGFEGGPQDVYLYAYAPEDQIDGIIGMSSAPILDILLKTGIYVHVIPLRPGTMTWLWDDGKKQARRVSRARPRVVAESRAKYKTRKAAARRKAARAA